MIELAETEKRILSLLTRDEVLTKKQIAQKTGLSWGTVVKFVTMLEEKQIIRVSGTLDRETNKGKNAYTYTFNEAYPLAIGVDVEYKTTHVILTNLKMQVIKEGWYPTAGLDDFNALSRFLKETISSFLADFEERDSIKGMGISLPGFGDPVFLIEDIDREQRTRLSEELESYFGLPNRITMNIKAYTMYQNLYGVGTRFKDFLAVTIRTGIGGGIVSDGQLYTGQWGLPGAIGHITFESDGLDCYCGKKGCLETLISKQALRKQFAEITNKDADDVTLAELFAEAETGNPAAEAIVKNAAKLLGQAIGHAVIVLNFAPVIVSTEFGGHRDLFTAELEHSIRQNILLNQKLELVTLDLDPSAHSLGASLMIINEMYA